MKVKYLWVIMITLSFFGCDDNTGSLGLDMLPEEDKITTIDKTYDVITNSILSGPVYARTDTAYIGRYSDSKFGDYNASFLSQLNNLDSLKFPAVYDRKTKKGHMVKDETLSTELVLMYKKYFGDPLSPIHIGVYELDKIIADSKTIHYTDINPEDYFNRNDPKALLGGVTFSAADLGTPDDQKKLETYFPKITVPLPKSLGEEILRKNRNNPEYFYSNDAFLKNVFKGIYVEADQGNGSIVYVEQVHLKIRFEYYALGKDSTILQTHDKKDSILIGQQIFAGTKEVFQLNRTQTSPETVLENLVAEDTHTYLKSPAGIFTELTLPIEELMADEEIKNDTIHSVKFSFETYNNDKNELFTMRKPARLLMVRKSEMKSFFEENKIPDNITSFKGDLSNGEYVFNNLSRLINYLSDEKANAKEALPEDWNKMVLIPVDLDMIVEKDYRGQDILRVIKVRHNLRPEYAKLSGGLKGNKIKMKAIFTSFNDPAFENKKK